jgi:hypothetical protein
MKLYPITIVDDFYTNPEEVRKFALSRKYFPASELDNSEGIFPGKRTAELGTVDSDFFRYSVDKLLSIFHDYGSQQLRWNISNKFQLIDSSYDSDWIHSDVGCVFAAIVYLTPDAPLDAGTSIYKKNSRFDQKRYEQLNLEKFNFYKGTANSNAKEEVNSMFTETVKVNNVYNRLLVYEAEQFHGGKGFFGNSLEDSRLTQIFFIKTINTDSYPLNRT